MMTKIMTQNDKKTNYLVIDFEATCSNNKKELPPNEMEIIEFAGILIDQSYNHLWEFTRFIKPIRHPVLTKFCTELTSINQNDVEKAKLFPDVLEIFLNGIPDKKPIFLSWGNYDKNQLLRDCEYHDIQYPFEQANHVNIKEKVNEFLKLKKHKGVGGTLRFLNMRFQGTPHRGIDDVINIIRILKQIEYPLQDLSVVT